MADSIRRCVGWNDDIATSSTDGHLGDIRDCSRGITRCPTTTMMGVASSAYFDGELSFATSAIVVFVGGFIIGLVPAIVATPPLPNVSVKKRPEALKEWDLDPTVGHLVAHTDGFWHLFNTDNELLSIPDDQVLDVRTVGEAHNPQALGVVVGPGPARRREEGLTSAFTRDRRRRLSPPRNPTAPRSRRLPLRVRPVVLVLQVEPHPGDLGTGQGRRAPVEVR